MAQRHRADLDELLTIRCSECKNQGGFEYMFLGDGLLEDRQARLYLPLYLKECLEEFNDECHITSTTHR